ncbi:MAG: hypothetical protein ACYDA2_07120 [Acidimicrobiales bacterium]
MGSASAITLPNPPAGPRWFNGNVETIRSAGSDTTFFMVQKLGDLYEQAGLYGCTLNADNATCNQSGDQPTTDTVDNYDRTEVQLGIDLIGSGAGEKQLCGATGGATPFPVDFARMSKAPTLTTTCGDQGLGFAKDGVPGLDFATVNPSVFGPVPSSSPYFAAVDTTANLNANGGQPLFGPVAAGWVPGDNVNGPYSGTAFTNITNTDHSGGVNSVAYRIYCATDTTQIKDWGQLTDGKNIGIPLNVVGVNPSSGTVATWTKFVQGSATSTCTPSVNAYIPPNGVHGGKPYVALENNTAQLAQFVSADFPGDPVDQAIELATMMYYESNGVYNTNPFAHNVVVNGTTYSASKLTENGQTPSTPNLLGGTYPTARTLFNVYIPAGQNGGVNTVRASTAGFLNWICDSNNAFAKGEDLNTGKNYDAEITTTIQSQFGFIRLTDTSAAPNNTCSLITSVGQPNT